jgi:dipeptidyl aminopeptidase/acylaminoacyl peptidase
MIKSLFYFASVFFLFFFLLTLWGFYTITHPLMKIVTSAEMNPARFNAPYEKIEFSTQDGVLIRGWFIPNKNPAAKTIILLHGYPADKGNILPSRIFLHQKFNLLFLDFRYLGESGGSYSTLGKNEVLDVLAAIDYLKKRGINEVGIWGFSLGGAVALMTAEKSSAVKAIVTEAAYSSLDKMAYQYFNIPLLRYPFGLLLKWWSWIFLHVDPADVSPLSAAKNLSIPILFFHSKADSVVSFDHAEDYQKALENKPNVKFIFWDHLSHGESENQNKTVEDFFVKSLGQ